MIQSKIKLSEAVNALRKEAAALKQENKRLKQLENFRTHNTLMKFAYGMTKEYGYPEKQGAIKRFMRVLECSGVGVSDTTINEYLKKRKV